MPLNDTTEPQRRRRGAALEQALLNAAWTEVTERGYDAFSIEGVAERAGTSRAVLYRRWPTKPQLVRAAIAHALNQGQHEAPDTGTVRGDLIEVLRRANATRAPLAVLLTVQLAPYYLETSTSLADLREFLLEGRTAQLDVILQRATRRGELDPDKLTPRLRNLPFDLFRHELLMTLKPVPEPVITEIVDSVFLPLVRS